MIKIIIADDHELIREGLKNSITAHSVDMEIIGEASDTEELMSFLPQGLPDIILLDISMPGMSGLDALKQIKSLYPKVEVLILSMHPENRYAVRALKAGAAGYFPKNQNDSKSELLKAIRTIVLYKQKYITPVVANLLAQTLDTTKSDRVHDILSDRELQVLCMIATGKKIKTIASELYITVQTVHSHRNRIKEKLNLKTDTEFTKYAIQNKLID